MLTLVAGIMTVEVAYVFNCRIITLDLVATTITVSINNENHEIPAVR